MPHEISSVPAPVFGWRGFVADSFFPTALVSFLTSNPAGTVVKNPYANLFLSLTWNQGRLYVANRSVPSVQVLDARTFQVIAEIPTVASDAVDIISAPPPFSRIYVSHQLTGQVSILSTETNLPLGVANLGGQINRMAIDPSGRLLFVMMDAGGSVKILDVLTDPAMPSLVGTIALPAGSGTVWITPDGKLAFISATTASVLSVVQLSSLAIIKTIPLPAGSGPFGLTILPDQSLLFANNMTSNTVSVIDIPSLTLLQTINLPPSISGPFWSTATPDGKTLFLIDEASNLQAIDIPTLAVAGPPVPVGGGVLQDIVLEPDPSPIAAFTAHWDDSNSKKKRRIRVSFDARGSVAPVGVVSTYYWNFGDDKGETATASPVVTHLYCRKKKPYCVSLRVETSGKTSSTVVFLSRQVSRAGSISALATLDLHLGPCPRPRPRC